MSTCSSCMSQNSQQGALNWLAGQVRVLLKKMENLENGQSRVPIALDTLVASSPATVQGGRTKICGQVASVFPEYIAPAPVASYATPASFSFAAPAPVVDRVSPDFTVYAVRDPVVEPAPMEHISPALAVYAAPQASQCQRLHRFLSWNKFLKLLRGVLHAFLWLNTSLQRLHLLQSWNTFFQLLQCVPHLFLWRSASLQHQRQASQCQRLHLLL